MTADLIQLHNRQRAKRTAQSKADYASALTIYRRPANWTSRVLIIAAAILLLAAWKGM